MRKVACFLIVMMCHNFVCANEEVDRWVEQFMKKKQIPGLALLVNHKGQTVKSKGYGWANIELQVPVKPETIFQSGSVGKQFTATAVMMLVEDGKIALDDPITKYLKVPKSWRRIKIRHMLTHTSGLGDYPETFDMRKDYKEQELLAMVTKQKLNFAPGAKWSYSNLAYLTLGVLIHKVSGKFYGDFLNERIWQPLGMTSTRIINEEDIVPNRAAGYRLVKEEIKNQEWVSPTLNTTADGAMYFNILDLAKWDQALYTEQLLKKSSLEQMWTPVKLNDGENYPYGFGWAVANTNGHKVVEHGGGWQGFSTYIARYPDDQLSVVVLTNLAGANAGYITRMVASFYNKDLSLPVHTAIQLEPAVLQGFAGKYKMEAGYTITITPNEKGLVMKAGGQELTLLPESQTSFFVEDSESTVTFHADASGKVTHLVVHTSAIDLEAKKIE